MKKFYILICAGFFLTLSASAQWTGGKFQTVTAGNFADPTIWNNSPGFNGTPPSFANGGATAFCNNCLIDLEIVGGGTITLNTGISLSGGSELLIGPGVTLVIPASGAADPTHANGINLTDQNAGQVNRIVWADNTAHLDASQLTTAPAPTAQYDGVYTSQMNGPAANNDFTLTKQIGVTPVQIHAVNGSIVSTTPGTPQFGNGTGIAGPITLSNSNGVISLPIVISSFTATLDQNVVNLAWTTSLESNADHFAIQRSVDAGAHWATIGKEAARGGSTSTNYTYADNSPATGTSEYRLQLVDRDGTYKYSEVRTVRNSLISAVSVFPNPAHDYVNVALGGKSTESVLIRLYNQNGQMIQLKNVANAGGTTVPLSVSGYSEGTYFIVVNGADGAKQVTKFLIAK